MPRLRTIGYEGATLEDFIATLHAGKVRYLLDVRALPVSRRRGFSKSALAMALEAEGIEYVHLRGLGDPKEGRDAARAGDYERFADIFATHMNTAEALCDLAKAAEYTKKGVSCLMCYERNPQECHRAIVAQRITDDIMHLGVQPGVSLDARRRTRESSYTRQSASSRRQKAR